MREIVCASTTIADACKTLVDTANERGGDDNCTVVIAEATGDDLPVHRDEETVTQTFEVMKAGPNTDIKSDRPPPKDQEKAADAQPQPEPPPPPITEGADMKTRPLQLAVAAVMMVVVIAFFYFIMR